MKTLAVAILWHLHQPYYTDPLTQSAPLPWVRLHAVKGYYDMGVLLEEHPEARVTVNLTPSLLYQLQELANGTVTDVFWTHASRPAADLSENERLFILRHFFSANWDTMIRPHDRYYSLLIQRGTHPRDEEWPRIASRFSVQDLLDLQVWHNLAWCGHRALARFPQLRELVAKGRQFSESDKQAVLAAQREILNGIIPLYRRLQERGQIELSTTPFFHPILPLLIDTDSARRSRPDSALPQRFAHPEDAEAQIRKALDFHETLFGRRPVGLWPSEGSVCPELIPILTKLGIRWAATDEDVLARSVDHWQRDAMLYRPYRAQVDGGDVALLFRDRDLSDAVGFTYSRNPPDASVADFCARLQAIAGRSAEARPLVPVILDGENPWEHYPDGGEGFLRGLYATLSSGEWHGVRFQTVLPGRELEEHPPTARLERLHTGSWINADLKIWLGHVEDNDAWERVGKTRRFLRKQEETGEVPATALRAAWDELYAAEGSDWFWWYGDEFDTDHKALFDQIFRLHLANVYRLVGAEVPEFLKVPVLRQTSKMDIREPSALIAPALDGIVTDFYEWQGAGYVTGRQPLSSMHSRREYFSRLYFGFSLEQFYVRLDPLPPEETGDGGSADVHVYFIEPKPARLVFRLDLPDPPHFTLWLSADGTAFEPARSFDTIRRKKVIELAVPFKELGLQAGTRVQFVVTVMQGDLELDRIPAHRPLAFTVPDHTFEGAMWKV
ncbi:MAG: glycoside hydrolase family 57 protein [Nitrospirota bacterium]